MRRFLLLVMIIMLPLRGMVGDAMAMEMTSKHLAQATSSQTVATNLVAVHARSTAASANLASEKPALKMPCHEMLSDADDGGNDSVSSASNVNCTSCQVCHLSALTMGNIISVSVNTAHAALAFAPHYWASAELPQATKPPLF